MEPYYEHNGITIYHGDCREILPGIEADVVVTDPPYGIGYKSGKTGHCGGTALPGIVGDEDTSLRDAVLCAWAPRPALVFGTWKRPRPKGTRHVLVWEKGDHLGMGDLSIPWRPNIEEIYILGSGFEGHRGTSVLRVRGAVTWSSRGRVHPHEKPHELLSILIGKCPPGTILDPFMGSGTTLRAAKDLGRKAIGIEIEERYCEIAAKRLAQEVLDFG